ncbi:hypothetical protein Tco_1505060 [Tanacetum coccineum]
MINGFGDSGCSGNLTGNIAHLSDFKDFDGGYVTFGRGAYGGRITSKGRSKRVSNALSDPTWVDAMQGGTPTFKLQKDVNPGGSLVLGNSLISGNCMNNCGCHFLPVFAKYLAAANAVERSAEASTDDNREVKINATIDGHSLSITEGSLRRHLKLVDQDGIPSIPNSEIFKQLALMGYHTDSDKLTFQKGAFSPQWRFLIHNILHCLSPKKTA